MLSKRKVWNLIGMTVGLIIVVCGVLVATRMSTPDLYYDIDYPDEVSFNGDFYTYQYEATREAANNIADVARLIEKFADFFVPFMVRGFGVMLIITGVLTFVCYGKKFCTETETSKLQQGDAVNSVVEESVAASLELSEEKRNTEGNNLTKEG